MEWVLVCHSIMKFKLEDITVFFPYEYIYPEQYRYMLELKRALDARGHCLLEVCTPAFKKLMTLELCRASYITCLNMNADLPAH